MEVNHTTSRLLKPSELRATACYCSPKARQQDINLQLASDDVFKRFETKTSGQKAFWAKRALSSNGSRAS
jgi:hypothetical protein